MKRIVKRLLSFLVILTMMFSMVMSGTAAAATGSVKMEKKSVTVNAGKKVTLKISNLPKKATVKWSSDKTKIASVNQKGVVTAKAGGKATITARVAYGKKTYKLTSKVTVKEIPVKLETSGTTLAIDGKATIKVKNAGKNKIKYSSAKASIAKVSSKGVVTGVKPGSTKIKVTTKQSGKTKTLYYNVKVSKPSLGKTSSVLLGEKNTLKVNYLPKKAAVTWSSSDTRVASVDKKGVITAKKVGKAKITAKVTYKKKTYTTYTSVTVKKESAAQKAKRTVSGSSKGTVEVYSITGLKVDAGTKKAQAVVSAPGNATLTVRFIEESVYFNDSYPNNKSYISGGDLKATASVAAGSNLVSVTANVNGELPERYVAEAVLTDGTGKELCNPFVCIDNTEKHEQFKAKTVNDFDGKRVVNFDSSKDNNFGVLASGVKKLTAESIVVTYGNSVSDKTYTIKNASGEISAGDKVYISDKDIAVIFRAKQVSGSKKELKVVPARTDDSRYGYDLGEFYEYLKIDMGDSINVPRVASPARSTALEGGYSNAYKLGAFSVSPSIRVEKRIEAANLSAGVSGDIGASAKCEYSLELFGPKYFCLDFSYSSSLSADINVFANAKGEKEVTVFKGAIPIGHTGLDVYANLKAKVKWHASGKIELNGSIKTENGVRFDSRTGCETYESKKYSWNASAKAAAGVELGIQPAVGAEFLGGVAKAELGAYCGVKGDVKAETPAKSGDIIHACDLCTDGNIKAFMKVNAKFSYNILDIFKGTPLNKTLYNKEWKLFDFYCSMANDKSSKFGGAIHAGTGKCPNMKYKTVFKAQDSSGKAKDANITVTTASGGAVGNVNAGGHIHLYPGDYIAKAVMGGKEYTTKFKITNTVRTVTVSEEKESSGGGESGSSKNSDVKNAKVGDIVTFGRYEQDNNMANGKEPIEWQVLAKENNKILVVSKYALDCKRYNEEDTDVTWETCTLRKWLDTDFKNEAFNATENSQIPRVTVTADVNPHWKDTPAGNNTQDQVFLLSVVEAEKYFSSVNDNIARRCAPTAYAKARRVYANSSYRTAGGEATCTWLLRSPGRYSCSAAVVFSYGDADGGDIFVDSSYAVRPALWINI